MTMHSGTRALAALAALLTAPGCGATYALPLEVLEPLPSPDASIRLDDLRLELRAGAEWLELRVRNGGTAPAAVDLAGVTFAEEDGRTHRLASGAQLAEARRLSWVPPGAMTSASASDAPLMLLEASGHHPPPALLERRSRRVEEIAPGEELAELFYPVEHLHRDDRLGWRADPLFCRRGTPAAVAEGRTFEVTLPLLTAGGWREVRIVARLRSSGEL